MGALSFQVGVVSAFKLYGCAVAVAGIYDGGGWQGYDFVAQAADEVQSVAPREVCAADGLLKEAVARE